MQHQADAFWYNEAGFTRLHEAGLSLYQLEQFKEAESKF
jgi:hypothetical protein